MNNAEFVRVYHSGHESRELKITSDEEREMAGNSERSHQSQMVCLWI